VSKSIEIEGLERIVGKLNKVNAAIPASIEAAAIYVKGKIDQAPPVRHGRMPMTMKQRKWFLMALREGLIDVPWRRGISPLSQRLTQSWTTEMRDKGMTAVVGNDTSYGPFVQDKEKQSKYHADTGWKTVQEVAETESKKVSEIVIGLVRKALEK